MGEVTQINIKNRTYYFYNCMINIKNFETNLLKIHRKSSKTIFTTSDILQLKKLRIVKRFTA